MRKFLLPFLLLVAAGFGLLRAQAPSASSILRMDPGLDAIVPAGAKLEKLAGGMTLLEGPVWVRSGASGYLIFSDIPANVIHKWTPGGKVTVYLNPSGYTGPDPDHAGFYFDSGEGKFHLFGSNGITLDHQGRVVFCAIGDRDVARVEPDGKRTVLADRYEGKPLNGPNDLVYKSDGALYFTDPAGGPRGKDDDPKKDAGVQSVYLLKGGKLRLIVKNFALPNGLAFSPDEKLMYIDDSIKKTITRFDVAPDDTLSNGRLFADMTAETAPGVPDGMKIDTKGNVYSTGPGGVFIYSPDGKYLGKISVPEVAANLAWGNSDGKTLFITARTSLYRIRLSVPGIMVKVSK